MTLLAILCSSSNLQDELVNQIQYLMNDKKADPNRVDINGNNCVSWYTTLRILQQFWFKNIL